jgi:hypothetical protein
MVIFESIGNCCPRQIVLDKCIFIPYIARTFGIVILKIASL